MHFSTFSRFLQKLKFEPPNGVKVVGSQKALYFILGAVTDIITTAITVVVLSLHLYNVLYPSSTALLTDSHFPYHQIHSPI